jgi:phage terminase Nu1 subunit (DNA packaging protein)
MSIDRLPRISIDHEYGRLNRWDIDWLIDEVKRLRQTAEDADRETPKLDATLAKPSPFGGEEWLTGDVVRDSQGLLFQRLGNRSPHAVWLWLGAHARTVSESLPLRPLTLIVRAGKPEVGNPRLLEDLEFLAELWLTRANYFRAQSDQARSTELANAHRRVSAVFRGRVRELRNVIKVNS